MNHYKHFTLKESEIIRHYFDLGKNQSEIAKLLERRFTIEIYYSTQLHLI